MPLARFLTLACTVLAAAGVATGASAQSDPYAPLLAPAGTCADDGVIGLPLDEARRTMLCLVDYARAQKGLAPLRLDPTLDVAGQAKLLADVSCGQFTHTPCGHPFSDVFAPYLARANGYRIGENIAWGSGGYAAPRATMDAWIHSDGHRENLLTASFRDVGIGYLPDQSFEGYAGVSLWSNEFGVRDGESAPAPAAAPAVRAKPKPRRLLRRQSRR